MKLHPHMLYLNVLIVATCGLVYELLAGTLASYLLGDSITQFSIVIGVYLSSLGVGAYLSQYVGDKLAERFVDTELAVALVGGCSAPALFMTFGYSRHFALVLYGFVISIGTLVGLELPLLMRILKDHVEFKDLISRILSVDYLGGLVASLIFPLICVPHLGLARTSLCFGLLNAAVAFWGTYALAPIIGEAHRGLRVRAVVVMVLLAVGMNRADRLTQLAEEGIFSDPIVHAETSAFQRIVVTRGRSGFQLFLNGNLQFASADEHRYHEALAHVPMLAHGTPARVLILGGGDGLALREVLHWPSVKEVVLIDLDAKMTGLSQSYPPLAELNQHAFEDRRVQVVNADGMVWLQSHPDLFDVALVDFPDPNTFALGKLYTRHFYRSLKAHLSPGAAVAVQSTSPLFARESFWCVAKTMQAAGFYTAPYHVAVPSFGEWGFVLGRPEAHALPASVAQAPDNMKFLNDQTLASLFVFPEDASEVAAEVNRLDNQALVRTYEREWRRWN